MKKPAVLDAFTLKLIMAALMLLDHIHYFLPPQPDWMTYLGRLVAPTFCYLMTESLVHTRNRAGLIRRLSAAGLIMLAGSLALSAYFGPPVRNGIFLSLALGAAIVCELEAIFHRLAGGMRPSLIRSVYLASLIYLCSFVEGEALIPAMAVIFYFLRGKKLLMCAVYLAAGSVLVLAMGFRQTQLLQGFAVIPILLHNGERGPGNGFAKWFFYIFYPAHVWILYVISQLRF